MRKVIFLWIFTLLLALPSALAVTQYELWNDTLFQIKDNTIDTSMHERTVTHVSAPQNSSTAKKLGSGSVFFDGTDDGLKFDSDDDFFSTVTNRTIYFWTNGSSSSFHVFYDEREVGGGGTQDMQFYVDTGELRCNYNVEGTGATTAIDGTSFPDGSWELWGCGINITGSSHVVYIIKNNAVVASASGTGAGATNTNRAIGYRQATSIHYYKGGMDHVILLNRSPSTDDSTLLWNNGVGIELDGGIPPEITFYNMTSEGGEGCTNWNTDKNNACSTSDTTPTVSVNTSESAYCAIGISNLNYTDLGVSRECAGGGTKKHTCTIISQDTLSQADSSVYIGCKDLVGNENRTSTSGALKLTLTGGTESSGRNAIESGITNALITGYTIYTDQKIYARNSANQQSIGTFDKVAKSLNKIWAFNYLTGTDMNVNMFNITPVLYTLELTNKTSAQITNEVELLINATK